MGEATSKTSISVCDPRLYPSLGREAGALAVCPKQNPKSPISRRLFFTRAEIILVKGSVSNVQQRCPTLFERMVTFLAARWTNQTFANVLETSDSPKPHMPTNANSLTVNIQLEWYSPKL